MTNQGQEGVKSASSLERIECLINDFGALRLRKRRDRLNAMADVISAFREQKRQLRGKRPAQFDVFSLFNIGLTEGQHSTFLAWLLDVEGSHGQGKLFLDAFLNACRPKPELQLPNEYKVQTEFWGGLSAVDILVYRPKEFVLYIENKTTSPDTPGQTDREFKDMRRLGTAFGVPRDSQIAIYLTPERRRPSGKHAGEWHVVAYSDFRRVLADFLPLVADAKVRIVLQDWFGTFSKFRAKRRS